MGRLEFEFGSIDCEFGRIRPPGPTSVETVSQQSGANGRSVPGADSANEVRFQ